MLGSDHFIPLRNVHYPTTFNKCRARIDTTHSDKTYNTHAIFSLLRSIGCKRSFATTIRSLMQLMGTKEQCIPPPQAISLMNSRTLSPAIKVINFDRRRCTRSCVLRNLARVILTHCRPSSQVFLDVPTGRLYQFTRYTISAAPEPV